MSKQNGSPHGEMGQILLIVILVVIVVSTIGLSLASRSIISTRTTTEEAESQKALSAAEAGIERILQNTIISTGINVLNGIFGSNTYSVNIEGALGSAFAIEGGGLISKDEGSDVWFVEHDANNNPIYSQAKPTPYPFLNLYWGSTSETCPGAIEVLLVTRNNSTGEIKSYRYTYDGCNRGNNFTQQGVGSAGYGLTIGGKQYVFKNRTPENSLAASVSNIIFMRVIPIYKDAVIVFTACDQAGGNCSTLPTQGYDISSTGTAGQASRKIKVFNGYPRLSLLYLSYGLFVAN